MFFRKEVDTIDPALELHNKPLDSLRSVLPKPVFLHLSNKMKYCIRFFYSVPELTLEETSK